MQEHLELARICDRVYPGPLNHTQLTISGSKLEQQRYIHGSNGRGFCRVFSNDRSVVVAFRGTRGNVDWKISNMRFWPEPLRDCGQSAAGVRVHRGFQRTLDYKDKTSGKRSLDAIFAILLEIKVGDRDLWITGHSLGGALATIFAVKLRSHAPNLVERNLRGITLFGAPAVGGRAFKAYYGSMSNMTDRFIHNIDPVPFTPPIGFSHVGRGRWYRSGVWKSDPGWPTRLTLLIGRRPSEINENHSMKAYVAALASLDHATLN